MKARPSPQTSAPQTNHVPPNLQALQALRQQIVDCQRAMCTRSTQPNLPNRSETPPPPPIARLPGAHPEEEAPAPQEPPAIHGISQGSDTSPSECRQQVTSRLETLARYAEEILEYCAEVVHESEQLVRSDLFFIDQVLEAREFVISTLGQYQFAVLVPLHLFDSDPSPLPPFTRRFRALLEEGAPAPRESTPIDPQFPRSPWGSPEDRK